THRQYFTLKPDRISVAVRLNYQSTISGKAPFYIQPYMIGSYMNNSNTDGLGGAKTLRGVLRNRVVGDGFVMADIPGLIEGAHKGVGLGHKFLRHIERCRMLIHIIDVSSENPLYDKESIDHELVLYPGNVATKEKVLVLNKIDLMLPEDVEVVLEQFKEKGYDKVFTISTATKEGVQNLVDHITKILPSIPRDAYVVVEDDDMEQDDQAFEIIREGSDTFIIENQRIQKLLELTDVYDERALNRFMKIITGAGVLDRLKKMGIREGDTVKVGDFQFDYYSDEAEV
ncbi:MAG: Obg family GTPase CgtA, partial [Candidatus Sericytochromatia bacterium]